MQRYPQIAEVVPISESEIRRALAAGEFSYVYQPKVSIAGNLVCGAEALLRWERTGQTILPSDFIALAEKSSLMSEITSAMLPQLIEDIQVIDRDFPGLVTSFNASVRDFTEGEMIQTVVDAIAKGKVQQGNLCVEVTETVLASNLEALESRFQVLLDAGVKLAMDDFGKGYSSLELLSSLPFTCLKLDHSMVSKLGLSRKVDHIVESICILAKKLGLNLIAEGVENDYAYAELRKHGCDAAQGFWISRPLPLAGYIDFVRNNQLWGCAKLAA